MKKIVTIALWAICTFLFAQNDFKGIYLHANQDSSQYLKLTFLNQVWLRYTDHNPGSTLFGEDIEKGFDIGLRRTRIQLFGNVYKNTFAYMQMGINNFSTVGGRKPGVFFHDAIIEHQLVEKSFSLGAGLTGWNGLSRYSAPSIGSILSLDAPLFAQTTNGATDQFLRKLSVYAKGKLSKLDYRLLLTTPMAIQQSSQFREISTISSFSHRPAQPQFSGYLSWQFLDQESNLTPYAKGTYLGKKKVFNIGAGFQHQQDAMWHLNTLGDTTETALSNLAVDVFIDYPLDSARKDAVTLFFSYYWMDFGPNYIRNIGAMNPANGNSNVAVINGGGTAVPVLGTGRVSYSQAGYLLPVSLTGEIIRLQPYIALTHANYDYLTDILWMYDVGINLLKNGHSNKLTFNYRSRPIFETIVGENVVSSRKGHYTLQLQIGL